LQEFLHVDLLQTTGLTGLAVASNPHHTLGVLYGKILRALQKMPATAAYRKYTEQIVKERAEVVKTVSSLLILTHYRSQCCGYYSYVQESWCSHPEPDYSDQG
jgi:hypothetical protein